MINIDWGLGLFLVSGLVFVLFLFSFSFFLERNIKKDLKCLCEHIGHRVIGLTSNIYSDSYGNITGEGSHYIIYCGQCKRTSYLNWNDLYLCGKTYLLTKVVE